jgi:hypothetical protein
MARRGADEGEGPSVNPADGDPDWDIYETHDRIAAFLDGIEAIEVVWHRAKSS